MPVHRGRFANYPVAAAVVAKRNSLLARHRTAFGWRSDFRADRAQCYPWPTGSVRRIRCPHGDRVPAAWSNPSPAVVEVLLKAGADVNAKDSEGWTPLHAAAWSNQSPAVLEVLLKAGADVNAKSTDGVTPLHNAAANNPSPAVLEILLKAGADVRAINSEGKTPHAVAKPEYRDILWKAMMDKPLK